MKDALIATITLNPSLDQHITVDGLVIDGTNRWSRLHRYAGGKGIFGVARGPALPLAECLEIVQREVISRQVKEAVKKHGTMSGREDKPVPVRPSGIAGVVPQKPGPEDIGHRGRAHRHAGVP